MLLLSIVAAIIAYVLAKFYLETRKYPKGPFPLPFIGNGLQFGYYIFKKGSMDAAYKAFKQQFGPVFTVYFGPYPLTVICDYDLAVDAYITKGGYLTDRWLQPMAEKITGGKGIVCTNGEYWAEQRHLAQTTLKNLEALKGDNIERRIIDEFHYRCDKITSDDVIQIEDNELFDIFAANIINFFLFSSRLSESDQKAFFDVKKQLDERLRNISMLDIFMPRIALKIPYFKKRHDNQMNPYAEIKEFMRKQVMERIDAVKSGTHKIAEVPENFVDAFLVEMGKQEDSNVDGNFDLATLVQDIVDLFLQGQRMISATLSWGIVYLLNYPEIASRVQNEIRSVTGGDRDLLLSDKAKTTYFNATINEIQRLGSIIPVNLFRAATEDVTVGGVLFRKGQAVAAHLPMIMHDEKHFTDPNTFNPDRYLSDESLADRMFPFSLGNRRCLGESIARATHYLILGNLIQKYEKFEAAADQIPSMEPENKNFAIRRPANFKIRLITRN